MQQDLLLKCYFSDNERYADLINGIGFGGKQVVKASDLTELDSQNGHYEKEIVREGSSVKKTKSRDLVRKTALGVNFAVVGIENQEQVHYMMPLRVMTYDAGEYQRQAVQIKRKLRKKSGVTSAEYLSGFAKDSKLYPCVTFVLFYGEEWDGSHDLHGILDFTDIPPELKGLVSNYSINVIEIRKLQSTDNFHTDLKQVFDFIRFSKDKQKLRELVENESSYLEMEESAYDVAVAFSGAEELVGIKKHYKKERKVNMCQALKEMLQDERDEGRVEGRREVMELLIQTCKEIGLSKEVTFDKIGTKFMLSDEETEDFLLRYWIA